MPRKQPNVLIIVSDQQRPDTVAALGNPIIKTPTLDRLCGEGTVFRRNYTPTPVCAPARGSLGTGRPPHEACMTDNCVGVPMDFMDFPTLLHDAGYQTFGVGRTHSRFAGRPDEASDANLRGFDRWTPSSEYKTWFARQGIDWVVDPRNRGFEYYYVPQQLPYPEKYSKPHWVADRAVEMLSERDADKPFLLCAHFGAPHPAWIVPHPFCYMYRANQMDPPVRPSDYRDYQCRANRFQNRYKWMEDAVDSDNMLLRRIKAAYYATISHLDSQVARILGALGDEIDNTLILYTSDHGEMLGDYGCVGKRCMLEPAVRVSMLARLPGVFEPGREVRAPSTLLDVMPTVCQVAGIEAPDRLDEAMPLQQVAQMSPGERIVFSQFSRAWNGQYYACDGERAYWHSAADKREWHFAIGDELTQGPILPPDERGLELRRALIERHRDDEYSRAVEGDDWADHDVPANNIHRHPDYGLLFAEPAEAIQSAVDSLGPEYARPCTGLAEGHPMAEHMVWMPEDEKQRWRENHADEIL